MKIYKYEIPLRELYILTVPAGAEPLSVQEQNGSICLWMLVDPNARTVMRGVRIYGTGVECDTGKRFFGTVQIGSFVWHVFIGEEVADEE